MRPEHSGRQKNERNVRAEKGTSGGKSSQYVISRAPLGVVKVSPGKVHQAARSGDYRCKHPLNSELPASQLKPARDIDKHPFYPIAE